MNPYQKWYKSEKGIKTRMAWREKNREKTNARSRAYVKTHPEQIASTQRKWRAKESSKEYMRKYSHNWAKNRREKILIFYGGNPPKCECCGETEKIFLCVDHKGERGAGNAHRKKEKVLGWALDSWIVKNKYPDLFRILCHNCNAAYAHYGNCPHKTKLIY